MIKKNINIFKLFICLICFFYSGYIVRFILGIAGINVVDISLGWKMFLELILSILISSVVIICYYKYLKDDFNVFKKNIDKNIGYIVKMFFLFMIIKFLVGFLSNLIIVGVGYDIESGTSVNQSVIESYVNSYPWIMVFTSSILAPLYEEVLFRLGFRKVLKNRILFVLVSGFVFGLMHIFPLGEGVDLLLGILQSISYVAMGIFLAYIYERSNNICTSIGIHFLNNFLSVLVMISIL